MQKMRHPLGVVQFKIDADARCNMNLRLSAVAGANYSRISMGLKESAFCTLEMEQRPVKFNQGNLQIPAVVSHA